MVWVKSIFFSTTLNLLLVDKHLIVMGDRKPESKR
jgi:hypothetical protein